MEPFWDGRLTSYISTKMAYPTTGMPKNSVIQTSDISSTAKLMIRVPHTWVSEKNLILRTDRLLAEFIVLHIPAQINALPKKWKTNDPYTF